MDRNQMNGRIPPSTSADFGGTAISPPPNYSSRAVQEALEHLASIDLIDLCNEAKVEHCRATRDLRSCGRYVLDVLNSCGHASLCSECSQRCDICPICRTPISKNGNRLRPRLYNECMLAGLISKRCDERFQENDDGENQLNADVQRLYSLFDVALENNLVSLICHYITDVCMDESAVSSDPVIAFLLDEVVVKDWCKRTFRNIVVELQGIYNMEEEEMKTRMYLLQKLSAHLAGISNVLEVLESSFKGTLLGQPHDLQLLQECILKAKQHLEIMAWCARHQFLENVGSRYPNFPSWRSAVRERKSAAIERSWPDVVNQSAEFGVQAGSLFIEDALENLEIGDGHMPETGEDSELIPLQKDEGLFFRSKIEGLAGFYPFQSLRSAIDVLFLRGSSDLVVAKQSIFLYYLYDRHWSMPDDAWRHIVHDFAATFGITRHSLLESLSFYLLDDHTEKALQEVCDLLPEISGPSTHPKVAQVLLERGIPETALMVLRWSGRDGSQMVSLSEAVTAVRVRVECGLLTEAFMHQRMLWTKVKENKVKGGPCEYAPDDLKGRSKTWEDWMELLVTEICCLCIKRNLVDRMIELPWNFVEEKYLHKCLFDCAIVDPSSTTGSLLVVFYLQRYRYAEAYQVNSKLQGVEQDFISNRPLSEEVLFRMRSASDFRAGLVAQSMELLPEVQQQQIQTGKLLSTVYNTPGEVKMQAESSLSLVHEPKANSLLGPNFSNTSLVLLPNHGTPRKVSVLETPKFGGSTTNMHFELGNHGSPSVLHRRLFTNPERGQKPEFSASLDFKHEGISASGMHNFSHINATPSKEIAGASLKVLPNSQMQQNHIDKTSSRLEQNGFTKQFRNTSPPYSHRVTANPVAFPDIDNRPRIVTTGDEPMDVSWSGREKDSGIENRSLNGGPRWRSDESSDEEELHSPKRFVGVTPSMTSSKAIRRSRFARR